jgi:hypothetical protein
MKKKWLIDEYQYNGHLQMDFTKDLSPSNSIVVIKSSESWRNIRYDIY